MIIEWNKLDSNIRDSLLYLILKNDFWNLLGLALILFLTFAASLVQTI